MYYDKTGENSHPVGTKIFTDVVNVTVHAHGGLVTVGRSGHLGWIGAQPDHV
jgi:hypothetical protein